MNDETNNPKVALDKKELRRINFRWLWGSQLCWNYERMQGVGFAFAMAPLLRKLYGEKEEMGRALDTHMQFFNTAPETGHIVLGAVAAMEAEKGAEAREAVTAIKTGLMGPFSAIGDTLFGVIYETIFGAIAAYMALKGSAAGVYLWFLVSFIKNGIRLQLFYPGYSQGVKLVTTMSAKLGYITEAATVMGLMVIGSLVASVVRATTPLTFKFGDLSMPLQGTLDQILPSLLPVCVVALVYWALGRKGMNSTKIIFIVLVLGVLLSVAGILGAA